MSNGYNFTERVRKVLALAREEAARLHHEYVGTEHILLGLIKEGEGVAAAVLQAMQFAPNAKKWKSALSKGDMTVRSTTSPQAKVLGDTSIRDMEEYYGGFFKKRPPVYA